MKRKLLSLTLLAALALAGCSKDDTSANGGGSNGSDDYGYVAVNIVQPKSMGNRAASDGFEYGSEAENSAQTGLFFIFDAGGYMMGQPQLLSLSGEGTSNTPEVERIYNAVLVVDGVDEENRPSAGIYIVCILNAPAGIEEGVNSMTALKDKIDDYRISSAGHFIMTNSVYNRTSPTNIGTKVEETNIATSAAAALNNPVEIYVERVVAKVRATATAKIDNQGATPTVDGVEKNFSIEIKGIEIANIAKISHLFKNVSNMLGASFNWAFDATNKRSYWEKCPESLKEQTVLTPAEDAMFENQSYDQIKEGYDENATLEQYIQPNTVSLYNKTAILVTAQLMDGDEPADLVYYRGGYFTQENALNLIAQYVANRGYYKKIDENHYSQLPASDFEWVNKVDDPTLTWLESYEVVAKIKDEVTDLYKKEIVDGEDVFVALEDVDEIDALLKGSEDVTPLSLARVYTDGMCYYFVNIDQTPVSGQTAIKYEGVVRNHIYDLTLNSIKGVGVPVFDPTDIIIPDKPEDEDLYYMAARINVLAWKLVSQTVNFE